ncbi:MAG: hypothetical protein M0Q91_04105 [Methanoregula sp.]|jgi:hypothetical protein|nr:hypothetical protein [Methanoregula sp.]
MDMIIDTVKKLETMMRDSGCEDSGVVLDVCPDSVNCQFERGACMTAVFGGRSADFVTYDPIRAKTKISFMFGQPLDTPKVRGAAVAIINVAAGFFCLSRILHSCPESSHKECYRQLVQEFGGKHIFCVGSTPALEAAFRNTMVTNPDDADVILVNGEGIIEPGSGDIIRNAQETKRIVCIGPSTAGIARLNQLDLWCPFGTC